MENLYKKIKLAISELRDDELPKLYINGDGYVYEKVDVICDNCGQTNNISCEKNRGENK